MSKALRLAESIKQTHPEVAKELERLHDDTQWLDDVRTHLIHVNDSLREEIKALKGEK